MNLRPHLLLAVLSATVLSASLTACGYTPLYAPAEDSMLASGRVQVGTISMMDPKHNVGERRVAQRVSQRLRQDLPQKGAGLDIVNVKLEETVTELAVQQTATLERAQLQLQGYLELLSPEGKQLLKLSLSTNAPYNVEDTPYSTESGRTYARLIAAQNMAEEISRRLTIYYRRHPLPAAAQ